MKNKIETLAWPKVIGAFRSRNRFKHDKMCLLRF